MNVVRCLTDTSLLTTISGTVQKALLREGLDDFQSRWALVVTWHNVSYSRFSNEVQSHDVDYFNYQFLRY